MNEEKQPSLIKNKKLVFGIVTGIAIIAIIGVFNFSSKEDDNPKSNIEAKNETGTAKQQSKGAIKIAINENDHIKGDKDAPITLVEFSDFQCPYCKKFNPTMGKIMEDYSGMVRLIYRHYPLDFHQNAQKSAEASECAGEQGKFWEYLDKAFANSEGDGTGLNDADLKKYSTELQLDANKFDQCLASGKFAEKVKSDLKSGIDAGIKGTPGTVLIDQAGNTQLISGALPYEQVKAKIDAVLK